MLPGDILLVHSSGFLDRLIEFGQGIRFGKTYAHWSHCAVLIAENGDMIEAVSNGVKINNISKYTAKNIQTLTININASDEDRLEIVRFATSCIDQKYGWLNFISTALAALTGLKFSFGLSSAEICSGLVSKALERSGAIFDYDANNISPAYLAEYYLFNKPGEEVSK